MYKGYKGYIATKNNGKFSAINLLRAQRERLYTSTGKIMLLCARAVQLICAVTLNTGFVSSPDHAEAVTTAVTVSFVTPVFLDEKSKSQEGFLTVNSKDPTPRRTGHRFLLVYDL